MRKKFVFLAGALSTAVMAFCLALAGPAFANGLMGAFTVGEACYEVGGKPYPMDAAPYIEDGRTFVPVRYLAYVLGVPESGVAWDGASRTVALSRDGRTVMLRIGDRILRGPDGEREMDVAPVLNEEQGRTYLPARFVAEAFGATVVWRPPHRVEIWDWTRPDPKPGPFDPPIRKLVFRLGERTAWAEDWQGRKFPVELSAEPISFFYRNAESMTARESIERMKEVPGVDFSRWEGKERYVFPADSGGPIDATALYVCALDAARAFGVPDGNLYWDGKELRLYGWVIHDPRAYASIKVGYQPVVAHRPDGGTWLSAECSLTVHEGLPFIAVNDMGGMLCPDPDRNSFFLADVYSGGHPGGTDISGAEGWIRFSR